MLGDGGAAVAHIEVVVPVTAMDENRRAEERSRVVVLKLARAC